jgi:hypothetical protein
MDLDQLLHLEPTHKILGDHVVEMVLAALVPTVV